VFVAGGMHNVAPALPRFPHLVHAETRLQVALDGLAAEPHPDEAPLARHSGRSPRPPANSAELNETASTRF
jgi:hypothetical protein